MKVTYSWLQDFIDLKISPAALAEKLIMSGLEVVSLEKRAGDSVFEIEITSNRPDWLSVFGIAREVAAITGKKMKLGVRSQVVGVRGKPYHLRATSYDLIKIEDKKDCPLYTVRIINNVRAGPSPAWLKKRL
ncbi:MAG: hypothetical protein ABIH91_03260, partial [Candidatus Omnitrophota bacterium]